MQAQFCLAVILNVVVHHASTTPICSPENDPETVGYHPHPTDCSKFLTCDRGALLELQCPTGTYWNDAIKACDLTEHVNCREKCPELFDPSREVFLPHDDCSKYYICTHQGAVEQSCPPGLHWNQNANLCDWPQATGCTAGTAPPTTASEAPTTTQSSPVGKCPEVYDPNDEVFLPHADCTKYYLCTWNGRPVEQSCPPGLDWNANANRCDWPAQAGCRRTYLVLSGSELSPQVLKMEELLNSMRHRFE